MEGSPGSPVSEHIDAFPYVSNLALARIHPHAKRRAGFVLTGLGIIGIGLSLWAAFPTPIDTPGFKLSVGPYVLGVVSSTQELDFLPPQPRTSRIVNGKDEEVARLHGPHDRVPVAFNAITPRFVQAVLAIEDRGFMTHDGLEPKAIIRALGVDLAAGEIVQGGSTITQQLVKNAITGSDRTWARKIKEASLSIQLESQWTKEEILNEYLNVIYLGAGTYGVGAASRYWFNTTPDQLTLPQSALLAGMIAAPSIYDPRQDPDRAISRRNRVLDAMVATQAITQAQADEAKAAPLGLALRDEVDGLDAVNGWMIHRLQHDPAFHSLGDTPGARAQAVFGGGLTIHTTIDPVWQQAVTQAIAANIPADSQAQVAVVAIEPDTGHIKAMVSGTANPDRPAKAMNLATQALRQPGSTFKPIVLATALTNGFNLDATFAAPATIALPDPTNPSVPWTVSNAGGADYGHLDLRSATAFSVNTVYAQLMTQLGVEKVKTTAQALGITTPLPDSPAIALGSGEVTVLDMASVQATLATGGRYHQPTLVRTITDETNKVRYASSAGEGSQRLDPGATWALTRAMTAVVNEGTGREAAIGRPFAGKTGTTQSHADAWFTGFTRDVAIAVWVGDPLGQTPLRPPLTPIDVSGSNWPAQIAGQSVKAIEQHIQLRPFEAPTGERVRVVIDKTRGCLPNANTPLALVATVDFPADQAPTRVCEEPTTPDTITVPNVVGLKADSAKTQLEAAGLIVDRFPEANAQVPPGVVWHQEPAPGVQGAPPFHRAAIRYAPEGTTP